MIKRTCPCGKEFHIYPYREFDFSRGKYCSRKCKGRFCKIKSNSGQFKKGHTPWIKGKTAKDGVLAGKNHPSWKGGLTSKNMQIRNSAEYKMWRMDVFERDKYTCIWCGQLGGDLCVDHIRSFSEFPDLRLNTSNGRTLCIECHKKTASYLNKKQTVCVTGSAGFIGSHICKELLERGYKVIGIDDYSKYGKLTRWHDGHKRYRLIEKDLTKGGIPKDINPDYIIHCAAKIGGIRYFHNFAYDLISNNSRIDANVIDSAIKFHKDGKLKRFIGLSSSMVYEGADEAWAQMKEIASNTYGMVPNEQDIWPTKEDYLKWLPPPKSTYGFSKYQLEMMIRGAKIQYDLPFTIIRPFNASGLGEEDRPGDSHVIPDLIYKALSKPDEFSILGNGNQIRCYTSAYDIARGIVDAMEHPKALNEDFNISTSISTSVNELASLIWKLLYGDSKKFAPKYENALTYDVQKRIPDVSKAQNLLGFEAQITLEESVREVVGHMQKNG